MGVRDTSGYKIHPDMLKRMNLFILWLIGRKQTHGYGLIKVLRQGGMHSARASNLYPLLNEMLKQGLISQREEKHGERIRKVYTLTIEGRKQLKQGKKMFSGLIGQFLKDMVK